MYKDSVSRIIKNQFLADQNSDYVKPAKLRSTIKQKVIIHQPFEDKTNRLQSLQNAVKPQNLQLIGYQSDDQVQNEQKDASCEQIKNQNSNQNQKNPSLQLSPYLQKLSQSNKAKHSVEVNNFLQSNKIQENLVIKQQINLTKSKSKDRRKIFNLQLSDSNQSQKSAQFNKKQDQINTKMTAQKDERKCDDIIFEQKIQPNHKQCNKKPPKKFPRFDVQISDQSSPQKPQKQTNSTQPYPYPQPQPQSQPQPQKMAKKEAKKFILKSFDSDQSQKDDIKNNTQQYEQDEYLEIIRNMNIQKLKMHCQFVRADQNFISFCAIPPESKTCLIVKRNLEKSQYTVYDSELVCQILRIQKTIGGTYKFIIPKDLKQSQSTEKIIAKMKVNFFGTQFHCYACKQSKPKQKYQSISITYQVNILGLNGPRKVKVYCASNPIPSENNLLELHSKGQKYDLGIKTCLSKTPKWMPELNAYVLNLRGTASHSSIKNCIIVDSQNQNKQFIIFGKKAKDIFNLQVKHPMTILQGVAFAVSSFERKLACQ